MPEQDCFTKRFSQSPDVSQNKTVECERVASADVGTTSTNEDAGRMAPAAGRESVVDCSLQNLGRRSVRGAIITLSEQATAVLLGLVNTAILARLLTPEDYGLVALVGIVVGFFNLFRDAGLATATIQQKEINLGQISTLFWLNLLLGVILSGGVAAMAPVVAWFFGRPELAAITIAVSATFFVNGLITQHQALLCRQLRFGSLAMVRLTSLIVSSCVGIIMACRGWGYWALIGINISAPVVQLIGVWSVCRWVPGRPVRGSGVRKMLRFGTNLLSANLITYAFRNLDNFLVGWRLGAGPLAIYSKAYSLLMLPLYQINGPISAVAVPALSRLQDSPKQFRRYYQQCMLLVAALGMPVVVGCFCATEEIVVLLLGQQWIEVTWVFRALAVAAFVSTFNTAGGWVLVPRGRADRELVSSALGTGFCAIGMLVGLHWGIVGVAVAVSVANALVRVPQLIYCYRGSPVQLRDLLESIWAPAVASVFTGIAVCLAVRLCPASIAPFPLLVVKGALFLICYVPILLMLPPGRSLLREAAKLKSFFQADRYPTRCDSADVV